MKTINLLPVELRPRKPDYKKIFTRIGVGLTIISLLGSYGYFYFQLHQLRQHKEGLESQLGLMTPAIRKVKELETQLANNRTYTLTTIELSHLAWSAILKEMSNMTPGDLWNTNMNLQMGSQNSELQISGETISVGSVGIFAVKLKELPYFSSVKVSLAQEDNQTYVSPVIKFNIVCSLSSLPEVLRVDASKQQANGAKSTQTPNTTVVPGSKTSTQSNNKTTVELK